MTTAQKVDYIFEVMNSLCEKEGEFEELTQAMRDACEVELELDKEEEE
jgi:hypothetical protein